MIDEKYINNGPDAPLAIEPYDRVWVWEFRDLP